MFWLGTLLAAVLVLGGCVWGLAYLRLLRGPRVICLMYHRVASAEAYARCTGTERVFTLPVAEFERQIEYLARQGYVFVTPDELRNFVAGRTGLPDRSVMITFDDGCESVFSVARPVLARHHARATVFVTTDPSAYVFSLHGSSDRRMTDEELISLDGPVVSVESHGVTHLPMRGMSERDLRRELVESKRELERILSRPVKYLGVPGNWYDRRVMRMAQATGYEAVWVSKPDSTRVGMSPFGLPRINVEGHLTLPQFAKAIGPAGILQRAIASRIKRTPGQLLGPRYWEPARKLIMKCIPGGYLSTKRILGAGAAVVVCAVVVLMWWWAR